MKKCSREVWTSVKSDIESKIISGEYRVGEKIPTLVEMIELYDIGKTTAQRVIDSLSDEGIIVKRVHAGSFILPNAPQKLSEKRKAMIRSQLYSLVELSASWGIGKEELLEILSSF